MLKKSARVVVLLLISLALVVSLTTGVTAAGISKLTVRRGGDDLNVAPILLQNGRAYAPYDALFTALGTEANYNAAAGEITAVNGNTRIIYDIDEDLMTVTRGEITQFVYANPTPIVDTSNGTIYISIRYAAQALGYVVGWDGATRSILLKSVDTFIEESGATYTVLDRYLSYQRSLTETCQAVDGTFDLSMDLSTLFMTDMTGDTSVSAATPTEFTLNGTATGLFDSGGEEMSVTLKTNIADLLESLGAGDELDDQSKALLEMFGDTEVNLILNNKTGMAYLQSPLFEVLFNAPEDAWISMETDTAALFSAGSLTSELPGALATMNPTGSTIQNESFKQYIADMLRADLLYDYGSDTVELLDSLNAIFSDQAMIKNGDDYTVTIEDATEDYYGDLSSTVFEMTFLFDGEAFEGISIAYNLSETSYNYYSDADEMMTMALTYSYTSDGNGHLALDASADGISMLTFDIDYTYTASSQLPARSPGTGSTVIPFDDLTAPETIIPEDESGLTLA